MRLSSIVLSLLLLSSCAARPKKERNKDWDSGAQKQEAFQDEAALEKDKSMQNQLGSPNSF